MNSEAVILYVRANPISNTQVSQKYNSNRLFLKLLTFPQNDDVDHLKINYIMNIILKNKNL